MGAFSAGVVPVLRENGQVFYLLLRSFNYWDFPKGGVDSEETPLKAALRELKEETAIENVRFSWGDEYIETAPYAKGKIARYYIAEVNGREVQILPNPVLGKAEHHEYRWVSYEEAVPLLGPRVKAVLDWAKGRVAH